MGRPRRTSSLGEDIRGDTSAPGISTMSTSHAQVVILCLSAPRPGSGSAD